MVTDQQIRRLYKLSNTEKTQEIAAAKAGMDVKTARKYLRAKRLPSEMKKERHWRTRPDWFEPVWAGIQEQLRTNPGLEAKTLFCRAAAATAGAVCGWATADIAAEDQALESDGRTGPGSVFCTGTSCR